MDEKKLRRHDFVYVAEAAREFVLESCRCNFSAAAAVKRARDFLAAAAGAGIPGIVRREEDLPEGTVALGFAPAWLYEGRRVRIAALARIEHVARVERPYEAIQRNFPDTSAHLKALCQIREYAAEKNVSIGVIGSAALEIITGEPYMNQQSDIDLLLSGGVGQIRDIYGYIKEKSLRTGIPMDVEVELADGYGVKAEELFMGARTVLGKSLTGVGILDKEKVFAVLEKNKL
jgi:phosphoribosyl-dephospho-CoA transferase